MKAQSLWVLISVIVLPQMGITHIQGSQSIPSRVREYIAEFLACNNMYSTAFNKRVIN